jgi:hypothetical protein
MPLQVQCPCGKRLQIPDTAAGKQVKCPACQIILAIQAAPAAEVVEQEFKVVEKPKPAARKPVKADVADDDDEDDEEKPRRKGDDDKPRPRSKSNPNSALKGLKAAAVSELGGIPDVDDEDDEPRPRKKKKKRRGRPTDDEVDAYWKTPQGMILNGIGLIGLGIGGITVYFLEVPRPNVGVLVAGIVCIGFGIGSIITGMTRKGKGSDDDELFSK